MDKYQTFYQPNPEIPDLVQRIEQQMAQWSVVVTSLSLQQRLVLQNKSLQASLALDHNSLSLVQLQELAAGKRVVALVQDIQQAQNALTLYQQLDQLNPYQSADLRKAHGAFMSSVSSDAGHYRKQGAGVYEGHKLVHMPPAPATVKALVDELLDKLQHEQVHPLLISCLMHYQLAFIHPFSDGNGRLCRLWQHLVLIRWQPCFAYLPFTAVLKDKTRDYQKALRQSVPKYDATAFILFMLRSIHETLNTELEQLELQQSELNNLNQTAHLPDQPLVDLTQFVQLQPQKVKTKTPGPWYKTEDQILKKLKKDNRLSAKTIADELGLSSRAIEKQLAKLKAEGKLLRTGPAKGGRWQVVA
jgi:Fic family protein